MSKEEIKNYGKSIRTKLLNVAKKENVFYQTILTRYFQERLLYRMSQTEYRSHHPHFREQTPHTMLMPYSSEKRLPRIHRCMSGGKPLCVK